MYSDQLNSVSSGGIICLFFPFERWVLESIHGLKVEKFQPMCAIIQDFSYIGTKMSKIFQEAFNETLDEFGIKATWLSEKTGVSNQGISRLRTGERDIYLQTFGKLFEALPSDAKRFFLEKILGEAIAPSITPALVINQLDPNNPAHRKQAADAFRLIGEKFVYPELGQNQSETRNSTDERQKLATLPS